MEEYDESYEMSEKMYDSLVDEEDDDDEEEENMAIGVD